MYLKKCLINDYEKNFLLRLMPDYRDLFLSLVDDFFDRESRLTVAVVGRMDSGKSTLINALVLDDIAPTSINECTATINRFVYSDDNEKFLEFIVHWRDKTKPETRFPLNQIGKWVGNNNQAEQVAFIDLFAKSNILRTTNIIDTPGTQSTLVGHEDTIRSFITPEELDIENDRITEITRKHAATADAVIYLLGPNARENDKEMLGLFGESTRIPGSTAYNSIAVIHKWEPEWQDMSIDPTDFLNDKIQRISDTLRGKVSCVIAASGLLGRSFDWISEDQWFFFARFGSIDPKTVDELTDSRFYFEDDGGKYPVPFCERMAVYKQITDRLEVTKACDDAETTALALIRFICRLACVRHITNETELKTNIKDFAGLNKLLDVMEKRFFSRSRLIKMGTVLSRLWEPIQLTLERLRMKENERREDVKRGGRALELLQNKNNDGSLNYVVEYVKDSFEAVESDAQRIGKDRNDIARITSRVERQFKLFENDIRSLELIDDPSSALSLTSDEIRELRLLFGVNGMEIEDRLGCPVDENHIYERFRYWAKKRFTSDGNETIIFEAAEDCFKAMLNQLSEN